MRRCSTKSEHDIPSASSAGEVTKQVQMINPKQIISQLNVHIIGEKNTIVHDHSFLEEFTEPLLENMKILHYLQ